MNNNKKIKGFIFKIIGLICIAIGIYGIVLTFKSMNNFESNNFILGGFITSIGFFVGFICIAIGFASNIKTSTKKFQEQTKNGLKNIINDSVDIFSTAINASKTVKNSMKNTKRCKYCGSEIDENSKHCENCGAGQ